MGYDIVDFTSSSRKGIILFMLVAVTMFALSVIMPNYILRGSLSYFRTSGNVIENTSICCVNDTYTCNTIIRYINESTWRLGRFNEINIIIYKSFNNYMRSNISCDIVLGLNEFEYIIAKNKNRIKHIDYFTVYSLLNKVPHKDLLFKSFVIAIPYCYTIKQLEEIKYSNIFKEILSAKNTSYPRHIKIYRLIIIENANGLLENIILYIIKNNTQIYGKKTFCKSIYDNLNITTINNVLSYYDVQHALTIIRGVNK